MTLNIRELKVLDIYLMKMKIKKQNIANIINKSKLVSTAFKILDWCPAGSVLPHGEKVPL